MAVFEPCTPGICEGERGPFEPRSGERRALQLGSIELCCFETGVFLDDACLEAAKLDRAQLQGSSFARARLEGASLAFADAWGARFEDSHLDGADFQHASCQDVSF